MVKFNELRITPDNKYLIIDAIIPSESYYTNTTIVAVKICTQKAYSALSDTPPADKDLVFNSTKDYCAVKEITPKRVRLQLTAAELLNTELDKNLFFVYIQTNGDYAPNTPCRGDNLYELGLAFNWQSIYRVGLKYIKTITNTCSGNCSIPKEFIDYILNYNAIKLALNAANYNMVIEIWDRFISGLSGTTSSKCNCI